VEKTVEQQQQQLNVYQRINKVRETNDFIKKMKSVDGQYKVVTHDQVTDSLRDDLIKHGVVIEPHCMSERVIQDTLMFAGQKKNPIIRLETMWDIHFVNIDNPSDRAIITLPAHALDTGDKAPGKAISYAVKAAVLKMFNIVTGENEEDRAEKDNVGDTLTMPAFREFEQKIDAINGKTFEDAEAAAQRLWEEIHAVCEKAKDATSRTQLRTRLTNRVAVLRKQFRVPAQSTKGNGNAAPQSKH
jgi:hypothetical protein